jgi:hypothetical protein
MRPASLILALGALCAGVILAPPARAGRPVPVYEVTVRGADAGDAAQDAMRQALVRATGRQDAATDPAFAQLVAHASDYVRASRSVGEGALQVTLDGAAIERQITADGRSVWDSDRPFTIVVLSPAPTGAADDETRRAVEQVAERRGLPVSLVPMPIVDQNGNPLTADALLTSAQRLGGDAVLLGKGDAAGASGEWQWTLITGFTTQSWNGSLDAGVNGAADAFARVEGSAVPLAEEEALVRVGGVSSLSDYATVERTLGELPGVRRSGLAEANGGTATFRVLIRGGAQAIERALMDSPHLTRTDAGAPAAASAPAGPGSAPGSVPSAPLAYQFHP